VSVGIALFPADAQTVTGFLQRADTALYDAKARGKRGYRFFEPEMDRRIQHRIKLEAELRLARAREEFFLEYQPQVNLANGSHAGVEALVRWRHPERGVVSPGDFIPIAEESGLIGEIGQFVLDASLAQARVWQEQGIGMGQLAINVSTRQFESEDFVASVLEALERHGIAPGVLELEITESLLMGGAEAIERITALHRAGVRFAIDDFGTGYSSLSYLKRVPISTLKIDRHFIADLGRGAEDRAITQAIIALGQSLEITTVAEGIDTGAGLDLLRRMGCTLGQGFVIAHPLPAASVPGFIRSWTQGRQRANGMPADPGAQGRLPDL
jgi:EAL domain-containing protein (putative c-di-GMP-specific phosphodiesterase class I)